MKLLVYLIKDHFLKMFGRVKLYLQAFLTSALDGDEWSLSDLGLLSPGETLLARWIRGWVHPEPVLALQRKKILLLPGIGSGFACR